VTFRDIETLEPLVHIAIAKKDTTSGAKFKFMGVVWMQVGPTDATEDTEDRIIWCGAQEFL
jgi:hypothetical protein